MYDMYPRNPAAAPADGHAGSARAGAAKEAAVQAAGDGGPSRAARAVQFALDRRDNGGRPDRDR